MCEGVPPTPTTPHPPPQPTPRSPSPCAPSAPACTVMFSAKKRGERNVARRPPYFRRPSPRAPRTPACSRRASRRIAGDRASPPRAHRSARTQPVPAAICWCASSASSASRSFAARGTEGGIVGGFDLLDDGRELRQQRPHRARRHWPRACASRGRSPGCRWCPRRSR